MKTAILLLNFGEPAEPTLEAVVPFLERIFATNASLEGNPTPETIRQRSRQLAEQRAPGLIHEYEEIGGSPLNAQAEAQARALEAELRGRGFDVTAYVGMQFADPLISDAVQRARADGVEQVIALPVYPLCGPSTTVAALEQLERDVQSAGWSVPVHEISGWHRHPDYIALRADAIRRTAQQAGVDLNSANARLVYSAHGTPMKYVYEGSRYVEYTEESCAQIAAAAGVESYVIGYQNHTNRPIEWTSPDIDAVIEEIDVQTVVVDPVSFMHEQSETLAELDVELREVAEGRGLTFYRVPVPHDDARFSRVLADLCEWFLAPAAAPLEAKQCKCRARRGTCCLNGDVSVPAQSH